MVSGTMAKPETEEAKSWQQLELMVKARIQDAVVSHREKERIEYQGWEEFWVPDEPDYADHDEP